MRAEVATQHGDFAAAQNRDRAYRSQSSRFAPTRCSTSALRMRAAGQLEQAEQTFATLGAMDVYEADALDLKQRALVALSVVKRQRAEAGVGGVGDRRLCRQTAAIATSR